LAVSMATETPTWGYTRIQGALKNLGHRVARSTIATILKQHGIPPSHERPTSWQTFLRAHWGALVGADFFTTEVWTLHGLVTYYTVFVIELQSRRVHILGSTPHQNGLHAPDRTSVHRPNRPRRRRAACPHLRPRSEVERRRSAAARDVWCTRDPDTVSGAQL